MKNQPQDSRVAGLDSLRFIAALWVLLSHGGGLPLIERMDCTNPLGFLIHGLCGNLFPGPAAVMVFFVISGFCIHYPFREPGPLQLLPYLARRYVRIGLPMIVAIIAAQPLGVNLRLFQNSILWTLFAELIYYSIYPLLRLGWQRWGWNRLILISFILALLTLLIHPKALDYTPFGNSLNWLLGLPCWLLGCKLADISAAEPTLVVSRRRIWAWRFAIWSYGIVASVLRFHSPVGYPWTLLGMALPIFFWLRMEIHYFRAHGVVRGLEWAGQWSYSVYLTHLIALKVVTQHSPGSWGPNLSWAVKIISVLAGAYLFYLIVEKPGHRLARIVSRSLRRAGPLKVQTAT